MEPIRVKDIMQTNPLCINLDTEINSALRELLAADVSGAPVIDEMGSLVGVLSQKDCIRAALDAYYHQTWSGRVYQYMSTEVETIEPHMELVNAAHFFTHSQYRRFPIVDDNELVGQISRTDVLKALSDSW